MRVLEVILQGANRSFDQSFTYLPPQEGPEPEIGSLVELPFGRGDSSRSAFVVGKRELAESPSYALKRVRRQITASLFRPDQVELAREIRRRYFCSSAQALQLMAPASVIGAGGKKLRFVRLCDPEEAEECLEEGMKSLGQERVLSFLLELGEASSQELMLSCQVSRSVLDTLKRRGLLEFFKKEVPRALPEPPSFEEEKVVSLNEEQEEALASILASLDGKAEEFLLFGVTGSGKTEVYLRAAEEVLRRGRDVLILVPEISLTPLICSRLAARFGSSAAVLHSRLSPGERYEQWRSIRAGEKHLVAGARSAIYAPLENVGLIVIDEEQESSYKSEMKPRYDARDIARLRSRMHGATLLLASATPSLESYRRTENGKAKLLRLNSRASGAPLPETSIVDMRSELAAGNRSVLSRSLKEELEACFARGEQAMLFLNRRGFSGALLCRDCGNCLSCDNCDVSLAEHLGRTHEKMLVCHYCGAIRERPLHCPQCGSSHLGPFGIGTEQLEEVLKKEFPERRFLRMDQDTTWSRNAHAEILASFARHEADALIGTQMIAKGHDFGSVSLVGILSADLLFSIGEYNAEERGFQLVCQAAGRAGRRGREGRVLIQAYDCENIALRAAAAQNYLSFYRYELEKRRLFAYPPEMELGAVFLSSASETACRKGAESVYNDLLGVLRAEGKEAEVQLFRPGKAPISRIKRRWRERIILKCRSRLLLTRLFSWLADRPAPANTLLSCEIDPRYLA